MANIYKIFVIRTFFSLCIFFRSSIEQAASEKYSPEKLHFGREKSAGQRAAEKAGCIFLNMYK
jgi:hypothetical protein